MSKKKKRQMVQPGLPADQPETTAAVEISSTAVQPPAAAAPARPSPKTRVLVIPRRGALGWMLAEIFATEDENVVPTVRIIRAAAGPDWRKDVPAAIGKSVEELEVAGAHLLLGACPEEQFLFAGLDARQIIVHPNIVDLPELPELLAGDPALRHPEFGTFGGKLPETMDALWALAEAGDIDPTEAEAACRYLARAALARFRAGGATRADMHAMALRSWFRAPGADWPHRRAFGLAEVRLHLGHKAAKRDWEVSGRIREVDRPGGPFKVAICESTSDYLVDWVFDAEKPDIVLRLEQGGFFCRASHGVKLTQAAAAWRETILDREPTDAERAALCEPGRPFNTPVELSSDGCTAGNRILANPHLPAVTLPADIVELLLIRSLA